MRAYLLMVVLAMSGGCGVEGLHSANPKTTFRFNPWSRSIEFTDNKDNDVEIEELSFDIVTKTMTLKGLKITNNASNVRIANRQQLEGLAIETKAIGDAWAQGIKAGAEMVASLVPMLGGIQANPIWGTGQPGAVPPGWVYVGPGTATAPAE